MKFHRTNDQIKTALLIVTVAAVPNTALDFPCVSWIVGSSVFFMSTSSSIHLPSTNKQQTQIYSSSVTYSTNLVNHVLNDSLWDTCHVYHLKFA